MGHKKTSVLSKREQGLAFALDIRGNNDETESLKLRKRANNHQQLGLEESYF